MGHRRRRRGRVGDRAGRWAGRRRQPEADRAGELGRVLELAASPDGRRVAVATHDGRVLLADVDSDEFHELVNTTDGDPCDLAFSPDSAWLAWSHPGPSPLRNIRMASTTDLSIVDVTPLRFVDSEPVFTVDGKHLAFLSARSFDPVYDSHVFDMSFPYGTRPHLVPLAATTPSPFSPQLRGRPVDDEPRQGQRQGQGQQRRRRAAAHRRSTSRASPSGWSRCRCTAARYGDLHAVKNGLVWLKYPLTGVLGDDGDGEATSDSKSMLERYDFVKRKLETLADGVDGLG